MSLLAGLGTAVRKVPQPQVDPVERGIGRKDFRWRRLGSNRTGVIVNPFSAEARPNAGFWDSG